jgi:hypothetical protein
MSLASILFRLAPHAGFFDLSQSGEPPLRDDALEAYLAGAVALHVLIEPDALASLG